MTTKTVIRAWKNPQFRNGLSAETRAALPAMPAGATELSEAERNSVSGGAYTYFWPFVCADTRVANSFGQCCGTVQIGCTRNPTRF